MSYISPSTAVTGGTLTTDMWNTQVRDNLNYLHTYGTATQGSVTSTQGSVASTQGSVVTLWGTAGTAVNLTATQGSVAATQGSVVTQTLATAIASTATSGYIYSPTTADVNKLLICSGTASGTISIPNNATQAFSIGQKIDIAQTGAGTVTIVGTAAAGGTATIRSTPSAILRTQYSAASIIKIGTDEWLLMGDLY